MLPQYLLRWLVACLVMVLAINLCPSRVDGQRIIPSDIPAQNSHVEDLPAHPLLSNINIRRALAYCTDRPGLITSAIPGIPSDTRDALLMDTFLPKTHWAYDAPAPDYQYPFNAEIGSQLLDDAGWTLVEGATYRRNAEGYELTVKLTSTNSQFRQTWAAALEEQWRTNCGIRLLRTHTPPEVFLGRGTGSLVRRDFELGGFAWIGQAALGGQALYGCDEIPTAENGWTGQNYMGWCNPTADVALSRANNTLDRDIVLEEYAVAQEEFAKDMISLPLFMQLRSYGTAKMLQNFKPDATEYDTWNAHEWALPGQSTLVLAVSNGEPANLRFGTSAALGRLEWLLYEKGYSQRTYDFQPVLLTELPTLESGRAQNQDVPVEQGDSIVDVDGRVTTLQPGVRIQRADGQVVTYNGGTVTMKQLTVPYTFQSNLRWSDGQPVVQADFELAFAIDCEPAAQKSLSCTSYDSVDFSDIGYTITYVPGSQNGLYFLAPFLFYPAHQVIESEGANKGKKLSEVPLADWFDLPEVVETPLTTGPYRAVEWIRGERLVLEPNPFYWRGTEILQFDQLIVHFDLSFEEAAQELEAGAIHLAESIFGPGTSQVEIYILNSPTWEHIDMNQNLYTQAVARVIPVTGGVVNTEVGFALTVPNGALSSSATVILNDLSTPTQSLIGVGAPVRAFAIDILDSANNPLTAFAQPLTLVIDYTDDQLGNISEQTLNVVYWDGEEWVKLLPCAGCSVDEASNRMIVQITHLSEFSLTGRYKLFTPSLHR